MIFLRLKKCFNFLFYLYIQMRREQNRKTLHDVLQILM